eukprot:Selendium_serpulae@DN5506_c0_g2_i1.p1
MRAARASDADKTKTRQTDIALWGRQVCLWISGPSLIYCQPFHRLYHAFLEAHSSGSTKTVVQLILNQSLAEPLTHSLTRTENWIYSKSIDRLTASHSRRPSFALSCARLSSSLSRLLTFV